MSTDKRYLERHGNQWRVQVKVPEKLRPVVGKNKLVKGLRTSSLATANRDRWPVVEEFRKILRDAERTLEQQSGRSADPVVREALEWRDYYREAQDDPGAHAEYGPDGEVVADGVRAAASHIEDRTIEISEREGGESASLFMRIALGTATPINLLVEDWLREKVIKPRQLIDYRRAVNKFEGWLAEAKRPGAVEKITRRIAGDYVGSLLGKGIHRKTINKDISALSTYWTWLEKRGYIEENIWSKQRVEKIATARDQGKRPFSDDEVLTFCNADVAAYLRDAIWIAALSGMRVEEIARLKVGDLKSGYFDIRQAKTKAGERLVPIHSALSKIVESRTAGKGAGDYLFHELPEPAPGSPVERSQRISKAFTTFRRRLGLDDRVEGARQARADFHSFRRWFITKAEMAGVPPHIISSVVGHTRQGMTLGTYSGGPSMEQLRVCVEAVRLPVS